MSFLCKLCPCKCNCFARLSTLNLERLAAYKYHPGVYTPFDNFLTPFWNWCTRQLPPSLAPNMVTLLGLMSAVLTTMPLLYYSPTMDKEVSSCWLLLAAAGAFGYQTLDAIDGKQARRLRKSSPLGQLFDHGCDAVSGTFSILGAIVATGMGGTCHGLLLLSLMNVGFFLGQWGEYNQGILLHGSDWLGVTEAQLILIAVDIISAIFGVSWWSQPLAFGYSRRDGLLAFVTCGTINVIVNSFRLVLMKPCQLPEDERCEKTLTNTAALKQLAVMTVFLVSGAFWIMQDDGIHFAAFPCIFVFAQAFLWMRLTIQLIISHMCKMPYTPPAWPAALPIIALLGHKYGWGLSPVQVAWAMMAIGFAELMRYVLVSVHDITTHLKIYCLTLRKWAE